MTAYAPGSYSGTIDHRSGQVQSTYTNGQTVNAGTLGACQFHQPGRPDAGLRQSATPPRTSSGQPVIDTPGAGQAGTLRGGNLEASNASTSSLLVSLIQYQQAYQANTSVIQTEQQDSQRLIADLTMQATSLYTGMAGLQAINARMEAIASNLANAQTPGYAAVQA